MKDRVKLKTGCRKFSFAKVTLLKVPFLVYFNSVNVSKKADVSQYSTYFIVFYEAALDIDLLLKQSSVFPDMKEASNHRTRNSNLQLLQNIPQKRMLNQSCASLKTVCAATLKPSIYLCYSGAASVIHLDSAAQSEALHGYQGQPAWRLQPTER